MAARYVLLALPGMRPWSPRPWGNESDMAADLKPGLSSFHTRPLAAKNFSSLLSDCSRDPVKPPADAWS